MRVCQRGNMEDRPGLWGHLRDLGPSPNDGGAIREL